MKKIPFGILVVLFLTGIIEASKAQTISEQKNKRLAGDSAPAPQAKPVHKDVAVLPRNFMEELKQQFLAESHKPMGGEIPITPPQKKGRINETAMRYGFKVK